MTIIRPKLLIIGHARHGKDTVGEWFKTKGYTFVSSSWFVGEKAVWPAYEQQYAESGYTPEFDNFEDFFQNRGTMRAFWYDAIAAYNRPDRSRLGRELFALYDMYVGLRNWQEMQALRLHKAYDLCIWVDASDRMPPEPATSMTISASAADVVVDNNGTLDDLDKTLVVLYDKWIRPLERSLQYTKPTVVE